MAVTRELKAVHVFSAGSCSRCLCYADQSIWHFTEVEANPSMAPSYKPGVLNSFPHFKTNSIHLEKTRPSLFASQHT